MTTQLPDEILTRERQIIVVIRADREDTSGATAPIIIQLPEGSIFNKI